MGEIRNSVGDRGMIIYTPNKKEACVAVDIDGENYTLKNEPAFLWSGREELFNLLYVDELNPKNDMKKAIRVILESILIITITFIIDSLTNTSDMKSIGMKCLLFSMLFIWETAILRGIESKKTIRGKNLAMYQGGLNKTLNFYEKHGVKDINWKEVKKESKFRMDKNYNMPPEHFVGIFLFFLSVPLILPKVLLIFTVPISIILFLKACNTSFFGILKLTTVEEPDEHDLKMACDLVVFWNSISNSSMETLK